jgi:hypothetical protein
MTGTESKQRRIRIRIQDTIYIIECPEPEGEEVEGFLDKLGDDRAEGGVARGHEDGPPALVHQAVHRSVESFVYRQRKTAGLVWLGMKRKFCSEISVQPYKMKTDPDPAFFAEHRSGSRVLMTKNWKNLQLEFLRYFF